MTIKNNLNSLSKYKFLIIGIGFIVLYLIVSSEFNFFVEPSTYYNFESVWGTDYTKSRIRYLSPHLLSYQLASIFLLLPGLIFLTIALARSKELYLKEYFKQ